MAVLTQRVSGNSKLDASLVASTSIFSTASRHGYGLSRDVTKQRTGHGKNHGCRLVDLSRPPQWHVGKTIWRSFARSRNSYRDSPPTWSNDKSSFLFWTSQTSLNMAEGNPVTDVSVPDTFVSSDDTQRPGILTYLL